MSENQARELIRQMQMLEMYLADLNQRESTLISMLSDATAAIESLKSLKDTSDSETLTPVGMGAYIQSKTSTSNKVFLNIGAGIVIKKDADSVMNHLEARIKEVQVAMQDTMVKKHEATAKLEQGKAHINQLMQSTRNPGSSNV